MCLWCVWDLVSFHVSFRRFVSSLVAVDAACGVPGLRWLLVPGIARFLLKRSVVKRNERNVLRKERLKTDGDRLFCRRLFLSYTTLIISFHLIYLNLAKSIYNSMYVHITIGVSPTKWKSKHAKTNTWKDGNCDTQQYIVIHGDAGMYQILIRYSSDMYQVISGPSSHIWCGTVKGNHLLGPPQFQDLQTIQTCSTYLHRLVLSYYGRFNGVEKET